jgi:hypothetical protein
VEIDQITNELLEAKDMLESLNVQRPGLESDPLFYEPLEIITKILEEIE